MQDKRLDVSLIAAIAWGMWALCAVAWIIAAVFRCPYVGMLSMILGAAAGTAHVRSFMVRQTKAMQDAYEIGREMGRVERLR